MKLPRQIFTLYKWLKTTIVKPSFTITSGGTLALSLGSLYTNGTWDYSLIVIPVLAFAFVISIILSLDTPGGIDGSKVRKIPPMAGLDLPFRFFIRGKNGRPCVLKLDEIDVERFEFVTKDTAEEAAKMNEKAFRRGRWNATVAQKLERNASHIQKNPHTIMFVKSLVETGKYLGYTHVLPVTQLTWEKYIKGGISDHNFHDDYVVADSYDEKAYGLIIFSVASLHYDDELAEPISELRAKVGYLYEQALVYHVSKLLETTFKNSDKVIQVLLQNDSQRYLELLRGCCSNCDGSTQDGARIIVLEFKRPVK